MEELRQHGWSPYDDQSPYYTWHMLTMAEWLVISRQYPFSVRALIQRQHQDARWSEQGRTSTKEQAGALMQGLAEAHRKQDWWVGWVVMESICIGQEVREHPVLWYPTQEQVQTALGQLGLLARNEQERQP